MSYAPKVELPPEVCDECWNDGETTCCYVPSEGRVWTTYCWHTGCGATLTLAPGEKPRWLVAPGVSIDEWATLLALSASKAQRIADEGRAAVRKASEPKH